MTATIVLVAILGAGLVVAFGLLDFGGEQLIASFGRAVIRLVTLGRVRLQRGDDSAAIGIAAAVIIVVFLLLLLAFAVSS
jgi:hypothetical protein